MVVMRICSHCDKGNLQAKLERWALDHTGKAQAQSYQRFMHHWKFQYYHVLSNITYDLI